MSRYNENIEKYLQELEKEGNNITPEALLTNCIVTSKHLILEIEGLEDKILKTNIARGQNMFLILGAKLELLIQEVRNIADEYFPKP